MDIKLHKAKSNITLNVLFRELKELEADEIVSQKA